MRSATTVRRWGFGGLLLLGLLLGLALTPPHLSGPRIDASCREDLLAPWRPLPPPTPRPRTVPVAGFADEPPEAAVGHLPPPRPLRFLGPGGTLRFVLRPDLLGEEVDPEATLARAREGWPGPVAPVAYRWDPRRLATWLEALQALARTEPTPYRFDPAGFVVRGRPGFEPDPLDRARIEAVLARGGGTVRLTGRTVPAPVAFAPDQLAEAIRRRVEAFDGVVGVYVAELAPGDDEVALHGDTPFSAASTVKLGILVEALRRFGPVAFESYAGQDTAWMLIWSDNPASNRWLERLGDGDGVEGARRMSATLHRLGLRWTFLANPFYIPGQPHVLGDPSTFPGLDRSPAPGPWTDPDPRNQTTPREMGRLLGWIWACRRGRGPLVDDLGILPELCDRAWALLLENADRDRLAAGLPDGVALAHKSGWIDDLVADVGVVESERGAFVVSVFVWKEGEIEYPEGNRVIADVAALAYRYFMAKWAAEGP